MKRAASSEPVVVDELVALTYELLDAHGDTAELLDPHGDTAELLDPHGDTAELLAGSAADLRWGAHVDYLRALQRKARELLALVSMKEGER